MWDEVKISNQTFCTKKRGSGLCVQVHVHCTYISCIVEAAVTAVHKLETHDFVDAQETMWQENICEECSPIGPTRVLEAVINSFGFVDGVFLYTEHRIHKKKSGT